MTKPIARSLIASLAALLLFAGPPAALAQVIEGTIVSIDPAKSRMKVGNADVSWREVKVDGFKVGDEVRIEYVQEDVHEPYIIKTIRKK